MTFSHLPADTRAFLTHLDNHGILAHIRAAASILAERGVATPPTLLDEIAERILEDLGRQPGGLDDVLGVEPICSVASGRLPAGESEATTKKQGAQCSVASGRLAERVSDATSKIRPHVRAAHAGVPLRLVTPEAV